MIDQLQANATDRNHRCSGDVWVRGCQRMPNANGGSASGIGNARTGSCTAGAILGLILGIWLGLSPFAHRLLDPYLSALNALPKVTLAPLFVLWFGIGIESKIALAAILVLFLVFLNTYTGVREVDQDLVDAARLMKASRWQVPHQGDHPFGGIMGVCESEDLGALCIDRRGAG